MLLNHTVNVVVKELPEPPLWYPCGMDRFQNFQFQCDHPGFFPETYQLILSAVGIVAATGIQQEALYGNLSVLRPMNSLLTSEYSGTEFRYLLPPMWYPSFAFAVHPSHNHRYVFSLTRCFGILNWIIAAGAVAAVVPILTLRRAASVRGRYAPRYSICSALSKTWYLLHFGQRNSEHWPGYSSKLLITIWCLSCGSVLLKTYKSSLVKQFTPAENYDLMFQDRESLAYQISEKGYTFLVPEGHGQSWAMINKHLAKVAGHKRYSLKKAVYVMKNTPGTVIALSLENILFMFGEQPQINIVFPADTSWQMTSYATNDPDLYEALQAKHALLQECGLFWRLLRKYNLDASFRQRNGERHILSYRGNISAYQECFREFMVLVAIVTLSLFGELRYQQLHEY